MKRKIQKQPPTQNHKTKHSHHDPKQTFAAHIIELRSRLCRVALAVIVFATSGYFIQQHLVKWLLAPSKGQQFIYTTPTGGLNFLFQVCIYFGIFLSIPVFIYQLLRYIEPLIHNHTKRLVLRYGFCSWLLAIGGAAFGYYLGLPVALRFLAHQFTSAQIKPLLTIQEYMSFVTIYLLGSALLFQIPLVILFINRIKPLKPSKLLGFERYFIAIAFIAAAIMTPTTDIFNQALFAGPIILVYQIGILLVYLTNRRSRTKQAVKTPLAAPGRSAASLLAMPNPFLAPTAKPRLAATVHAPRGQPAYTPRLITDIGPLGSSNLVANS